MTADSEQTLRNFQPVRQLGLRYSRAASQDQSGRHCKLRQAARREGARETTPRQATTGYRSASHGLACQSGSRPDRPGAGGAAACRDARAGEDGLAQARPRHNRQDDRELTALGPYRNLILAAAGALVHVAPQSPPP